MKGLVGTKIGTDSCRLIYRLEVSTPVGFVYPIHHMAALVLQRPAGSVLSRLAVASVISNRLQLGGSFQPAVFRRDLWISAITVR